MSRNKHRLQLLELQVLEQMTDAELEAAIVGEPAPWIKKCTDVELRFMMTTGRVPYRFRHLESVETPQH